MEPSADAAPRRRTRIACKPCRQNKNRCGMRSPPCARCLRLNIHCTVEPFYRRVNQQDRVQQLEAHVQELRDLLKKQEEPAAAQVMSPGSTRSPGTRNTFPSYMSTEDGAETDLMAECSSKIGPRPPRRGLESGAEASIEQETLSANEKSPENSQADYAIGPVKLTVEQVDSLIAIFFQKYHPMLPILDESRSAVEYHKVSRLLFWSIVAVASRHYATDSSLLIKLTPTLSELLWKTTVANPISITQVQALVLNSCWPLPNFRFWTDKSRVYANIALNYATELGLHMSGHEQEYSRETIPTTENHILERLKAWAACKVLSHSLSMDVGLPPTLSLRNYTIFKSHKADTTIKVPLELQQNLLIQECSERAIQMLFDHTFEQTVTTKLNLIEKSFDSLHQTLGDKLSFMTSLRLSGALLYFQCIYFLVDEVQESEAKRQGLLRAYETANSIISTTISHDYAHEELQYVPTAALRLIFLACLVIFRVLHSSYASTPPSSSASSEPRLNYSAGQVLYNSAGFAVHQCSVSRDHKDLAARMPDMLKELWRIGENDAELRSREPTLQIKTRMGASLAFDCLRIWRENRNRQNYRLWDSGNSSQNEQQQQQQQINRAVPYVTPPANALQQEATMQTAPMNELNMPMFDWFGGLGNTALGGVIDSEWAVPGNFDQNYTEDWGVYGFM